MKLSMAAAIRTLFEKQGWEILSGPSCIEEQECVLVTSPDSFSERIIIDVKQPEMSRSYLVDITGLSGYPEDMLKAWMEFYEFLCDRAEYAGAKVYAEEGLLTAFDSDVPQSSADAFVYIIDEFNNIRLVENV